MQECRQNGKQKRLTEYAKQQAEVAQSAEEMRMLAEAARIQAEINKQSAEREYKNHTQTAVLLCVSDERTI